MADDPEWESVEEHDDGWTERLAVPAGWLYRVIEWDSEDKKNMSLAVVFVPRSK